MVKKSYNKIPRNKELEIYDKYMNSDMSMSDVCDEYGISIATGWRIKKRISESNNIPNKKQNNIKNWVENEIKSINNESIEHPKTELITVKSKNIVPVNMDKYKEMFI